MKVLITACLLVVVVNASFLLEQRTKFQDFKLSYGKTYKSQVEETKRFNIFRDKLNSIEQHNALYEQGLVSYKQGINQFTDITQEEFEARFTFRSDHKPRFNATKHVKTGLAIPDSVDWRTRGQVTEAKNQGSCLSCYAFSVVGSIEAAYYRKTGKLVSLSEQQIVDCAVENGCDGVIYIEYIYPYVQQNGLQSEDTYSYIDNVGTCKFDNSKVVTKIDERKYVEPGDEDALLDAVANVGPVSVTLLNANLDFYESGIFEDKRCNPYTRNHAVLIVGYGTENGKKFWIVKNSYGPTYGEDGYFRIIRGQNECGIAEDGEYPIIY